MMIGKTSSSKIILAIVLAAFVGTTAYSSDSTDPKASADCGAYAGVWRYDVKGTEGMMIVSGNYAIGLMTPKDRPPMGDSPSEVELDQAFTTPSAWAVKIRCEGDRIYNEYLYSLNPADIGQVVVSENEVGENQVHWWPLAEDGSRIDMRLSATRVQ